MPPALPVVVDYTWKRMLDASTRLDVFPLLFDIINARAFHQKQCDDPSKVGVRAVDPFTLVVELERTAGYFLQMLTTPALFPRPRHLLQEFGNDWPQPDRMAASGPFKLAACQPGQNIVLARNPHYHGQFRGNLEILEFKHLPDFKALVAAYDSDELDVFHFVGYSPAEMHNVLRQHAGEYILVPLLQNRMSWFNTRIKPLDDIRVRRALVMCFNSQAWVDQVASGLFSPTTGGLIPPGMPGHSPGIGLPYDLTEARRLLAEAGYPGGKGIPEINHLVWEEHYFDDDIRARDIAFMQEQWGGNLGVKVNHDMVPTKDYGQIRDLKRHHLYIEGWIWDYPDPHNLLSMAASSFYNPKYGWRNPSYEQLVRTADATMDQGERIELYRQADQILMQDAPCILYGHNRSHILVKPWVKKFTSTANKVMNFSEVILEPH